MTESSFRLRSGSSQESSGRLGVSSPLWMLWIDLTCSLSNDKVATPERKLSEESSSRKTPAGRKKPYRPVRRPQRS